MAGKRIGRSVYVQAEAIDAGVSNLTEAEQRLYRQALQIVATRFRRRRRTVFLHQIVHIKGTTVRLLQISSFCEPHPYVIANLKVDVQMGICEEDKPSGRIFHRLDTILSPHEPAYNFHYAVTQFEEQSGLIGRGAPMNKVGLKREWRDWIDRKYGFEAYERKIRRLRREHLERIEPSEIEMVNGTAQFKGAVGPNAVVVNHLIRTAQPGQRVLNFGCGAADRNGGVPHSVRLEREGLEVTNHDIGDHADHADPDALHGRYDIVMFSNVLHVLPSWTALAKTLVDISSVTKPDGVAVMNYPRHPPSFMGTTPEQVRLTIEIYFKHVCIAPIKLEGPIFQALSPR